MGEDQLSHDTYKDGRRARRLARRQVRWAIG